LTVLFITHKYPPAFGGMENQSFHLINGINKMLSTHQIIFDQKEPIWKFFYQVEMESQKNVEQPP
jgi:hypothetical protein